MSATPRSPLAISCPWCHAAVGEPCSTAAQQIAFARGRARNRRSNRPPHEARVTEAANTHLAPGYDGDPWEDWTPPPVTVAATHTA